MTSNAETFRRGVAAYRNGRDWTKQQRDEAIKQANKTAAEKEVAAPPQDDGMGLSIVSEASAGDAIATSQETIVNLARSNTPSIFHESNMFVDEPPLDFQHPVSAKRSARLPQQGIHTITLGQ